MLCLSALIGISIIVHSMHSLENIFVPYIYGTSSNQPLLQICLPLSSLVVMIIKCLASASQALLFSVRRGQI